MSMAVEWDFFICVLYHRDRRDRPGLGEPTCSQTMTGLGKHMKMRLVRSPVRTVRDQRGILRIFEKGTSLPFALKRCYVISHVPAGETRGGHSVSCDLFITPLTGMCRLTQRNDQQEITAPLSRKTKGVLVHKGTWLCLDRFSRGAIVLVCASQLFKHTHYSQLRSRADVRTRRKTAT